jgi:hypothetical protein
MSHPRAKRTTAEQSAQMAAAALVLWDLLAEFAEDQPAYESDAERAAGTACFFAQALISAAIARSPRGSTLQITIRALGRAVGIVLAQAPTNEAYNAGVAFLSEEIKAGVGDHNAVTIRGNA